jgi:CheY-like chemotaxis protein
MYQRTVLMIDIRDTDRRLMNNAFDEAGCGWNFVGVEDTGEALRRLNTDRLPDLILLTLDPDAAGLQFVRTLRAEQEWQTIPVVVFSGGTGPQEAEAVYASGVSDYITKPLDFDGHIRLVSELLTLDYRRTQNATGTGMLSSFMTA